MMKNNLEIQWVAVGAERLAIGHRPKLKRLSQLRENGVTHVLTLLSDKEGSVGIGEACGRAGIEWLWLPLENATPPTSDRDDEIVKMFCQLLTVLSLGGALLLHCSAGIHRTGMITDALLRFHGFSQNAAQRCLGQLREHTAVGVGPNRLAWGDQLTECHAQNMNPPKLDVQNRESD